jgi:flagella basal body P-ring formation protein FlgA
MSTVISGVKILAAIEEAGIPADTLGYAIPRLVNVTRAGRVIEKKEVLDAVAASLRGDSSLDVKVRDVRWSHGQIVPEGVASFEIARVGQLNGGKVPLKVNVLIEGKSVARFLATAIVDDWREVPVLNKTLERGMLISPSDVELVRLNLFKQPVDIVSQVQSVVGKRLKSRVRAGGPIRESFIDIPPTIVQGKRITMRYASGGLVATATGKAMEDGLRGERIRVKNDSSNKIVRGFIVDENNVEVSAE